jgi:hypothetical protein
MVTVIASVDEVHLPQFLFISVPQVRQPDPLQPGNRVDSVYPLARALHAVDELRKHVRQSLAHCSA